MEEFGPLIIREHLDSLKHRLGGMFPFKSRCRVKRLPLKHLLFAGEQERDGEINKGLSGKERLSPWFGSSSSVPEHPPWWGGRHAELQITSSYCSPQTTQKHGQVEMGLPLPTATSIRCIWSSFLPLQNCLPNEQRQHLC